MMKDRPNRSSYRVFPSASSFSRPVAVATATRLLPRGDPLSALADPRVGGKGHLPIRVTERVEGRRGGLEHCSAARIGLTGGHPLDPAQRPAGGSEEAVCLLLEERIEVANPDLLLAEAVGSP